MENDNIVSSSNTSNITKTTNWSELDRTKFYTIGTVVYTGLTALLHPITVVKTRQQVLEKVKTINGKTHQPTSKSVIQDILNSNSSYRGFYRGLPIVVGVAVPARVLYISVLEASREFLYNTLSNQPSIPIWGGSVIFHQPSTQVITAMSSGIAGGIAAIIAQSLVVPMDVISQRQIVAEQNIGSLSLLRRILGSQGISGLYKGFTLSLLSSLPGGTIWWAVYSGAQHNMLQYISNLTDFDSSNAPIITRAVIQFASGCSAAVFSAIITQPLDVLKVRLQVEHRDITNGLISIKDISRKLHAQAGIFGFYRGLIPRITHLTLWGTILSSAYEYLKLISRVDNARQSNDGTARSLVDMPT